MINKIIVEVESTNTKIDLYDGNEVKRIEEVTILFKKNYVENGRIDEKDVNKLIKKILELKIKYNDIYICGTSIFRTLKNQEKEEFLNYFKEKTGIEFNIISADEETILTVKGATKNIKEKACVFICGGGSVGLSFYDKKIINLENTSFGVIDIIKKFPDLADNYATTPLEEVMDYIEKRINIPDDSADILILAGGAHIRFVKGIGMKYRNNDLYKDIAAPIIQNSEDRIKETKKFFEEISLDEIRNKSKNSQWWDATRAMCAFVLVVIKHIKPKYIVATDISMVYGLLDEEI